MESILKWGAVWALQSGASLVKQYMSEEVDVVSGGAKGLAKEVRWHLMFNAITKFVNNHTLTSFCTLATIGAASNAYLAYYVHERRIAELKQELQSASLEVAQNEAQQMVLEQQDRMLRLVEATRVQQSQQQQQQQQHNRIAGDRRDSALLLTQHQQDQEQQQLTMSTSPAPAENSAATISTSSVNNTNCVPSTTVAVSSPSSSLFVQSAAMRQLRIQVASQNVDAARQNLASSIRYTVAAALFSAIVLVVENRSAREHAFAVAQESNRIIKDTNEHDMTIVNNTPDEVEVKVYNNVDFVKLVAAETFRLKPSESRKTKGNYGSSITSGAQFCLFKVSDGSKLGCKNVTLGKTIEANSF